MSLAGTGTRFIESSIINKGIPGGCIVVTIACFPTGSYPALGEPISTLFAAIWALPDSRLKVPTGVRPSTATIEPAGGHNWVFDPAQGTMGSLRNYTAGGATPAEHATGNYSGTENTTGIRVTFWFPLLGDMTR